MGFSSFLAQSTTQQSHILHKKIIPVIYNLILSLNADLHKIPLWNTIWEFHTCMTSGVTIWIWCTLQPYSAGTIYYRCKQFPANHLHMFWTCLWLTDFWLRLFDTLKQHVTLNTCLVFPQEQTCQLQHAISFTAMQAVQP